MVDLMEYTLTSEVVESSERGRLWLVYQSVNDFPEFARIISLNKGGMEDV